MPRSRWSTWGVLVLFSASLVMHVLVLSGYVFLNNSFTTYLCENTDKPEMKCNGSCAVKKVLQVDEGGQQRPNQLNITGFESLKFLEEDKIIVKSNWSCAPTLSTADFYLQHFLQGFPKDVFRPPAC